MLHRTRALHLLLLLAAVGLAAALDNGLSARPALGYNTWNAFGKHIDENLIRETADRLVELGLADEGYRFMCVDDAWSERGDNGRLEGHRRRFPSGIKSLADYIHSKGLLFGIYSDAGSKTCARYPGSRGFEEVDAQTFADWGVDYLKYDNCFHEPRDWVVDRYVSMRDALNRTGRPILFALCEWGEEQPWMWADQVGNSWRTTLDIKPTWRSIMSILDQNTGLSRFAKPGAWNDMDMLEVGNGRLTLGEQRAHFALWSLLKSPLLIGADLRRINPASLAILKTKEVIAINQDSLGVAGDLVWVEGEQRIYAAPLAGGARAVVLLNGGSRSSREQLTVRWEQLGLPANATAVVRDLYAEKVLGEHTGSYTAAVPGHDVAVLRITLVGADKEHDDGWRPWHQLHGPLHPLQAHRLARNILVGGLAAVAALLAWRWGAAKLRRRQQLSHGWRPLDCTAAHCSSELASRHNECRAGEAD